jgi:hypothetical protein
MLECLNHGSIYLCSDIQAHIDIVGENYYGLFNLINPEKFKNKLNFFATKIASSSDLQSYYALGRQYAEPYSLSKYNINIGELFGRILR